MKKFFFLACLVFVSFPDSAQALKSAESSFRIEDKKNGALILGSDEASVEAGETYKSIVVLWGNLQVYGKVDELVLLSGHVTFHAGSEVTQSLVILGGGFETQNGAKVASEQVIFRAPSLFWRTVRTLAFGVRDHVSSFVKLLGMIIGYCLLWIFAFLLVLVFPKLETEVAVKTFALAPNNFFFGSIGAVLSPVLMVLLVVSILGILILPLYFLLLGLFSIASYVAACLWTGNKLLPSKVEKHRRGLSLLAGLAIFQIIWFTESFLAISCLLFVWFMAWGSLLRFLKSKA